MPFDWLALIVRAAVSWVPRVRAIKERNPSAVVLATFHATEIWAEDLVAANRWLPESCLMRNADGSVCRCAQADSPGSGQCNPA